MRTPSRKLLFLILALVAAIVPAAIAVAGVVGTRGTLIISPPGGSPSADGPSDALPGQAVLPYTFDGTRSGSTTPTTDPFVNRPRPADNIEFSQDNRKIRLIAYDSSANNLVAGQPGDGHSHIYVLKRNVGGSLDPGGQISGTLVRVDPNAGGDSIKPSLDGQTLKGNSATIPHCVVFQSTSRLTKDDTSSKWSIYLFDVQSGKFKLRSPAGVDARDGVVDGHCSTITYESGGKVYLVGAHGGPPHHVANGFNPDQETDGNGVAYDRDGQVYYTDWQNRSVKFTKGPRKGKHHEVTVFGNEQLVSVNPQGQPGNGPSEMPSVNDNGAYVAFESLANDLCNGTKEWCGTTDQNDQNGQQMDVYRRTLPGKKAPTPDQMEMISYDGTINFQSDLESDQVKISGAGEQACFRSFGAQTHDVKFGKDGHTAPFMHIYFWNFPRERLIGKFTGESKSDPTTELVHADGTQSFNWSCGISNRGNLIGFTSDEENQSGETNGKAIPDMFVRFMGGSDEGL
jgi:hypothetical protein